MHTSVMINGFYTIVEKPNVVHVVENFYKGLFAVRNGLNVLCNLFFDHSENKVGDSLFDDDDDERVKR